MEVDVIWIASWVCMAISVAGSVVESRPLPGRLCLRLTPGVWLLTMGTDVFVGLIVAFDVGVNKAARAVDVIC